MLRVEQPAASVSVVASAIIRLRLVADEFTRTSAPPPRCEDSSNRPGGCPEAELRHFGTVHPDWLGEEICSRTGYRVHSRQVLGPN